MRLSGPRLLGLAQGVPALAAFAVGVAVTDGTRGRPGGVPHVGEPRLLNPLVGEDRLQDFHYLVMPLAAGVLGGMQKTPDHGVWRSSCPPGDPLGYPVLIQRRDEDELENMANVHRQDYF